MNNFDRIEWEARQLADTILDDIELNPELVSCKSFDELHEHSDANMLGMTQNVWQEFDMPLAIDIINIAQEIVDNELKKA